MMKSMRWIVVGLSMGIAPAVADDTAAFPAPLPGWQAGEVKVSQREEELLGMEIIRRKLEREYIDAENRLIGIVIDTYDCEKSTLISALHQDSTFRKKLGDKLRPLKLKGYEALEFYAGKGQRNIVTVKIIDCGLVHVISGPNPPPGAIDAYLQRLDLSKITQLVKQR